MRINETQRMALAKLGIKELNAMQQAAVAHCRNHDSMVLLSPTGTGKTIAFLLPLLERLDASCDKVQAVIVLPSRELAKQVFEVWRAMATPFHAVAFYGGRPLEQEMASLGGAMPAVVIGTPGRLLDHLNHNSFAVDKCSLLVIDEFDKCLEMGFQEEMQQPQRHVSCCLQPMLLKFPISPRRMSKNLISGPVKNNSLCEHRSIPLQQLLKNDWKTSSRCCVRSMVSRQ